MGSKLYVGNLSYNTTSSDLEQLFGQFGAVQSAEVISDRETGRSKGFGFVQMGSDDEAQAAINGMNGQQHDGRALTVNEAKPREDRPRGGGGGGGYGGAGGGGGRSGGGGGGHGRRWGGGGWWPQRGGKEGRRRGVRRRGWRGRPQPLLIGSLPSREGPSAKG